MITRIITESFTIGIKFGKMTISNMHKSKHNY
jgi:hypothetical protein